MAERRMFTKKVTDDDNFMALSSSAQALYLHLSMSADDDGFCNQVNVAMFKAHASVQDLQALLERRYVYQFENGVIVIRHWRMANALRKDRYTETIFKSELQQLQLAANGVYEVEKSLVAERLPQDRIGKDRIGEDRKDSTTDPQLARVMRFYTDRINAMPSTVSTSELVEFTRELGADVVIHAMEIALDERKTSFSYIRAILNNYRRNGLRSIEDVLASERRYVEAKKPRGDAPKSFADMWREMQNDEN